MSESCSPKKHVRPFRFKQFEVAQSLSPMKVGTDGVLLGAYAKLPNNGQHILDVGCGTGLIALMMAQRYEKAMITAIDLDEGAVEEAQHNAAHSPFAMRIVVKQSTIQDFNAAQKFDLIVSNPPYYVEDTHSPYLERNLAKHTDTLTPSDLMAHSARMLAEKGLLTVIVPCSSMRLYSDAAERSGLSLRDVLLIKPTPDAPPKRVIATWHHRDKNIESDYSIGLSYLVIEKERHHYSDDYIALTSAFYLKM